MFLLLNKLNNNVANELVVNPLVEPAFYIKQ